MTADKDKMIDRFIDDLNKEKKPEAYKEGNFEPEDEKLFETIRAVKRSSKERRKGAGSRVKYFRKRSFKVFSTAAAAVLMFLMFSGILTLPGGVSEKNIVQAVVKAYDEMQSYSGIVEIRSEENGQVEYSETIKIQYKKPWKYKAVHEFEGVEVKKYSDGDRLIIVRPQTVEIENVFPEKELWRYHIGVPVSGLENAVEVNKIKTDTLLGREAVLLEYRGDKKDEFNRVWIDTETDLPLRTEIRALDRVLIREFKEIEINPYLDDVIFDFSLEEGKYDKITRLNKTGTKEDLKDMGYEFVEEAAEAVPDNFEIFKVGIFEENHMHNYVLRFKGEQESDFIDIYYSLQPDRMMYSRDSKYGKLGGGYAELYYEAVNVADLYFGGNYTARWFTDDFQLFLVSNQNTEVLAQVIEGAAGESIEPVSQQEIIEEGIELPITKRGH